MHASAVLLILTGSLLGADPAAMTARFDTADALKTWTFYNGAEFPGAKGRIEWNPSEGHDQPGCLALHYSFAGGGNYVQAAWNLPKENAARTVNLWLKKPGLHRITFRTVDATGQTFQKGIDYHFPGWQQLEVDLAAGWTNHWGGANDGKFRFPLRTFGVLIENTAEPPEGVLLIDDVQLNERSSTHGSQRRSSYVATDFAAASRWWPGGGQGNALRDGQWDYRFTPGHSPAISTDFSLLGQPQTLRLVLDSDGSGHALHAQIGSHFQIFHRRIGTLDKKGEQTFEVPLAEMSTWEHHSGPNDGHVRYPLRMQRFWLEPRPEGPQQGRLSLKRVEVDFTFPAEQSVLLTPDVRTRSASEGTERARSASEGTEPARSASEGPKTTSHAFSIELRNLRSTPAKGQLICEYRNLSRRLDVQAVELELPAGAVPVRKEFLYPAGENHMVEASFQWVDPDYASKPVSIGVSMPVESPGAQAGKMINSQQSEAGKMPAPLPRLEPESIMGCGLYLYRWRGNHTALENMTRLCQLAQAAGIRWTREEIQWHATEPEPGRYDFSFYDQVVEVAHAHGISVYGLLCYWSSWTKPDTQEGIDAYCRWVRQVVRHYKDRIKYWEIWNEPNIFFWTGPKELYAKLLTQAYEAVKAEDPEAVVLGCSTSGIDTAFIKMVMDKGGKFDALTIHPYRGALLDLRYIEELQNTRKLVDGRDVWITEIGFPSQLITGYSERRQASLAARVYLASTASGAVRNIAWYDFRNDGPDPFEGEQNFGLVRSDFRLKPAYRAVATVCRTLGGMKVKERIDLGPDAYAFRFSDGQRDVVAACSPESGRLLTFETDAEVRIVDGVGQLATPQRRGQQLTVTLDTGFPVFISGKPGFVFRPVDAPVRLTVDPQSVRPGNTLTVSISQPAQEWDLPHGWARPEATGDGAYVLRVPENAPPGRVDLQAIVGGDTPLRLPFTIRVASPLIRL